MTFHFHVVESGIWCGPIQYHSHFRVKLFPFSHETNKTSVVARVSSVAHNTGCQSSLLSTHLSCRSPYASLPSLLLPHNPTQESLFPNPETPPFFLHESSQNSTQSDLSKNNLITSLLLGQHPDGKTCFPLQQACTLSMSLLEGLLHAWSHLFSLGLWRKAQLLIAYHLG